MTAAAVPPSRSVRQRRERPESLEGLRHRGAHAPPYGRECRHVSGIVVQRGWGRSQPCCGRRAVQPSCCSCAWIRALTVDCVPCSRSAALTKFPAATTARKGRANSVSEIAPRPFVSSSPISTTVIYRLPNIPRCPP